MIKLRARHWWMLAIAWFTVVGVEWAVYLKERAEKQAHQARMMAWKKTTLSVQKKPTANRPSVTQPKNLEKHLEALSFPRYTPKARADARGYISHQLLKCGYNPTQQSFSGGVNIYAEHIGRSEKPNVIVVGAHYDTVQGSPGADDNASGVAGVLELACLLKTTTLNHTIRFIFFDGEEQGLVGSRAYVANHHNLKDVTSVLILEMIASTCDGPTCQKWPKTMPKWLARKDGQFVAAVGDMEHLELLRVVSGAAGLNHPAVHAVPIPNRGQSFQDARRSDHSPFWDVGIGAVMITDTANFRNKHYHRSTDTKETLNIAFMSGVIDIVHGALLALGGQNATAKPNPKQPRYSPASK